MVLPHRICHLVSIRVVKRGNRLIKPDLVILLDFPIFVLVPDKADIHATDPMPSLYPASAAIQISSSRRQSVERIDQSLNPHGRRVCAKDRDDWELGGNRSTFSVSFADGTLDLSWLWTSEKTPVLSRFF